MTAYETILLDVDGPFAAITLNRPAKRNAINFQMMDDLIAAFDALATQPDVRAVVLAGAGDHFCAGGDFADMLTRTAGMNADEQDRLMTRMDDLLHRVMTAPHVVIAKVQGSALGGGFGLVCAVDIALASTTAVFGMPEVRLGLAPSLIAPYVIQRVGLSRARLLMLTGGRFDGVSAHEYGVVQEVCPPDILDECTRAILTDLSECSPSAIRAIKDLIFAVHDRPTTETALYRAHLINTLRLGEDGQEGMTASLMKRKPRWAVSS